MFHGPVDVRAYVSATPSVPRSAYLRQVARIAPPVLRGRQSELAALTAFCTDADAAPYVWWRADAWAGKSALLSWFVLHPPAGVRVVSFFISSRFAGQSDRTAFTEVVLEQLATLLHEPLPALLTDATREAHLLDLLARAARHCRGQGQRLVLVVDGLDEDQELAAGPHGHSIAALLPAQPPAGIRVVVSGRPNPRLPSDVPAGHPLRDRQVIRDLAASPHAAVQRDEARRELHRLLHGTVLEQDLLGLLVTARGGLRAADLAELTGTEHWQVEERLAGSSARTFSPRPGLWRAEETVYVLAHDGLQEQAVMYLADRLDGYRRRLHGWAETRRSRGWRDGPPEYLLRGYFELLRAGGELSRMLVWATDAARHEWMLRATGGDAAALTEIAVVNTRALDESPPDLVALTRLAFHRNRLSSRNEGMPRALPVVWAVLGEPDRAEAKARSIGPPDRMAQALASVAIAVADAGDVERAAAVAETITDASERDRAMAGIVNALAVSGDVERAEALARTAIQPDPTRRSRERRRAAVPPPAPGPLTRAALPPVAAALVRAGDLDRALALVGAHPQLVEALADTGDVERAEAVAAAITEPAGRAEAMTAVAVALTRSGRADRALLLVDSHVSGLARVAVALADAGDAGTARLVAERAVAALALSLNDRQPTSALVAVADAMTRTGGGDRVLGLAQLIPDNDQKITMQLAVAAALASAGDAERAETVARAVPTPSWWSGTHTRTPPESDEAALFADYGNPHGAARWAGMMARVVAALGRTGDVDRARSLSGAARNPGQQAQILTALAHALAVAGRTDVARAVALDAETTTHTSNPTIRSLQLFQFAQALVQIGDVERAVAIAPQIDKDFRKYVLADIAVATARSGDADAAERAMRQVKERGLRARTLADVAVALAQAGNVDAAREAADRAEALAPTIRYPFQRVWALTETAVAFAHVGDPGHAIAVVDRIDSRRRRPRALVEVVDALMEAGDQAAARDTARHAGAVARSVESRERQAEALAWAAAAMARADDLAAAVQVARQAVSALPDKPKGLAQAEALATAAVVFGQAGDTRRAEKAARRAALAADETGDPEKRAEALTAAAVAYAKLGLRHRAEALAGTVTDDRERIDTLIELADAIPDHAAELLGRALQRGTWIYSIGGIARHCPAAVTAVADDLGI
ncbi:hypothetical protein ACFO1B_48630 [Dactylosporangium siamense]|uniref:Nephrocystin 3-like N-terminal domain-containing protein n=1 Tax=Dactylosporangium siamense TaxID=685454 RepID=A0A919UJ13_9ACTN|nr:hypothetical protein [Dactylosporangium siamense]GIG52198.1 hypothetical protein Dsi01nite_102390 [Dactylosporangium siamense]